MSRGGHSEHAVPWMEEEDDVLKTAVEENKHEGGKPNWEAVGAVLRQRGFINRTGKQARHRYARILNGQKKPGRNKCLVCGQPKKGHSCTGSPSIAATGFSAAQIRKGRASAARRTAKVNEAQSPIVAEFAAMLDAAAFSAEPTAAAEHAPAPQASRPITPMGDAASAAAPARSGERSTVRSSSPSYGSPVAPPALGKNFSFFSTLAQEMASVSTPATFALFDALATDAKVAPPDEPTPLDLDHVKRAKFSPPHEPADTPFDGVPSLVDGNFLPAWI